MHAKPLKAFLLEPLYGCMYMKMFYSFWLWMFRFRVCFLIQLIQFMYFLVILIGVVGGAVVNEFNNIEEQLVGKKIKWKNHILKAFVYVENDVLHFGIEHLLH